ncbi:MAG: hypothetical protein JSW23_05905 [Planctomycetota bacterium]|nr:MAG: hypothetical protein JSW23_05905 [Planctomycetota bacterium]
MNSLKRVSFIIVTLLSAGCRFYSAPVPLADHYFLNPDKNLYAVGRVALIQLNNDSSYPQIAGDTTEALYQALQKKQVFGVTLVHQDDPAWRSLQLDLDSNYTLEQLAAVRRTLNCDAILTGTLTEYQPYPHLTIGLRLKLLDLRDGTLLWALEQIWDSADKATEYRIKDYFLFQVRSGYEPLREQLVAVSSLKFVKFVAYEVAETLNP